MTTSRIAISSALLVLGLSAPAMAAAGDGWGASWSFGPVHPTTSNHIIHTKTTLVPGRLPTWPSGVGPLFLWPGLSNPTSDLVQTTADAWGDNANACGAKDGQWCLEASVFGSFGQRSGPSVSIDPDDQITIDYALGSDNNTWTQTVSSMKLGKVVSTLTSTSGLMLGGGFGFATEADANSYTIDTQYYLCTEIHLAAADPAFGATGVGGIGAKMGATGTGSGVGTAKNLHTSDGGLTWTVDLITLPAMNPMGTQAAAPAVNCTYGGTGGAGGSGGGGAGGTTGKGGASGSAGTTGKGGTTGGSAGTNGRGGTTGGAAGTSGKGGTTGGTAGTNGRGGTTGGIAGTNGTIGTAGTNGAAGTNGGVVTGAGGEAVAGTTGASGGTSGAGGLKGTGGTQQGAGGSVVGHAGTSGSSSGGSSGESTSGGDGSSGCSCNVAQGGSGTAAGSLLLLGLLVASRRRRRSR